MWSCASLSRLHSQYFVIYIVKAIFRQRCRQHVSIYDDASCVNETGESKSKDGFIHPRYHDMEKARSDEATE